MSTSRKWVMGVLVVASMAVSGVASALDDAIVESMVADIAAAIQAAPSNGTEDQKAAAVKAALDGKTQYAGKIDELIQALSDAKIADTVAVKVVMGEAPAMTRDQVAQNISAAKIVTETKTSANPVNPVTAAGNAAVQVQAQAPAVPSAPVFSAPTAPVAAAPGLATAATAPSNAGTGTGVSPT